MVSFVCFLDNFYSVSQSWHCKWLIYATICLSITLQYCVKTRERIGMRSSPSGSPVSLVFVVVNMVINTIAIDHWKTSFQNDPLCGKLYIKLYSPTHWLLFWKWSLSWWWCARYCRIFLIDHAWTYRPDQARAHLESVPSLLSRMALLMNIDDDDDRQHEDVIDDVLTSMWRCVNNLWVLHIYVYYCLKLLTLFQSASFGSQASNELDAWLSEWVIDWLSTQFFSMG